LVTVDKSFPVARLVEGRAVLGINISFHKAN
jgi:hypothetical protein